jgi:arylsulfatase A-like enzyme
VRLDRTLAKIFDYLDRKVGLKHCVIVLTADHGVAPLPEKIQAAKGVEAAGRINGTTLDGYVNAALDAAFGPLPEDINWWALRDNSGYHLNPLALRAKDLSVAQVAGKLREALLAYPMIAVAYTREQLMAPGPLDAFGEASRLSYFPARSPDVIYIPKPYFIERALGATHGTPYAYDTHVPQLWFGAGVKPGVHPEFVHVEDIAPTLAGLLGVDLPPEAKGKKLF